jgi:acetyl esterase/lipase
VGSPTDDDTWNRFFADTHNILVIALNYSKAPWATYPTPLLDVEALYHTILNDESLPIDKRRVALLGFDAGGNLALALAQLPSVKSGVDPNPPPHSSSNRNSRYTTPSRWSSYYRWRNPPPTAVISIAGLLDLSIPPTTKLASRRDKPAALPRGWVPRIADWSARQLLIPPAPWTHYIPSQGQGNGQGAMNVDVTDPLVSPARAKRTDLPPHVFVIAAELDWLALESWRAACRWAAEGWGDSIDKSKPRRVVPGLGEKVGRPEVYEWRGCLDDGRKPDRERFAWCELHDGGRGSTRWLLVPDVLHGFDSAGWRGRYLWGDEVARMDAEMKTIAYQREIAEWLWEVVWGGLALKEDQE